MSLSAELYAKLDQVVPALGRQGAPYAYDPDDPGTLQQWFKLLWHTVRASVPLLCAAREALASLPPCAFHARLDTYYRSHMEEEREHDTWMLEDLELLGIRRTVLFREMPPWSITAMVGSQYYLVKHYHPALLLGYMALLEGYCPSRAKVERLRQRSAAPKACWRTYLLHAEEDPGHRQEICQVLDVVPATDIVLRRAIRLNAVRTARAYADALAGIAATAQSRSDTASVGG